MIINLLHYNSLSTCFLVIFLSIDKMHSSSQISTNSDQNERIQDNLSQLYNTSSKISIVKANSASTTTTNNIQTNCRITSSSTKSLSSKIVLDHQARTTINDVVENYLQVNNIDVNDRIIQEQFTSSSINSNENTDLFLQSPQPNEHSRSFYHNGVNNSSDKGQLLVSM